MEPGKTTNELRRERLEIITDDAFITNVLISHKSLLGPLLENASEFRFQVLLSDISLNDRNLPCLFRSGYRTDAEYFYPASTIKLCAAVSTVLKVQSLANNVLDASPLSLMSTPLTFLPLQEGDSPSESDSTNLDGGALTLGHEIRKMLLVSDNPAFNRLYSFVGHKFLNQSMWDLGLESVRLQHRLSVSCPAEDHLLSEAIALPSAPCGPLALAPTRSHLALPASPALPGLHVGMAFINSSNRMVGSAMDFSCKNRMSLAHLQDLLILLTQPQYTLAGPGLDVDPSLRRLLLSALEEVPRQSRNPRYSAWRFPDHYGKFFLRGVARVQRRESLRVVNKAGRAYGFSVDNAFVEDRGSGRGFFLAVCMYTNRNGVLNDDRYQYSLADRLLDRVAEVCARAVWKRPPQRSLSATCLDACAASTCLDLAAAQWVAPSAAGPQVTAGDARKVPDSEEEVVGRAVLPCHRYFASGFPAV